MKEGAGMRGGPSFGERRLVEETRERFLREIVSRVPLGRLAAVHLFRPIRQGGFESGVAVIAAEPAVDGPAVDGPAVAEAVVETAEGAEAVAVGEAAEVADPIGEPACDPTDAAAGPAPEEAEPEEAEPEPTPDAEPRPTRHTVFTARYRLAIKGPERGKWDVEVVEEADAPMVTVEAVVRGVQRRAGDEGDPPERLDAPAVARLVGAPAPP
jgi:hypothetical protein